MLPLISVIVPVYKVEAYLPKAIDSVRHQTYKNLEIILVDDGSPDNCGHICEEYAAQDHRITVFHKKNGGLSDARNYGIERASGQFISLVDSDDYVDSDYVEYLYGLVRKYNVPMSICQHRVHYNNGTVKDLSINTLRGGGLTFSSHVLLF